VNTQEEQVRRGSHAISGDQEFSWVLLWTIIGAVLPGAGLIAAGHRRAGRLVLAALGLTGVATVGLVLSGNVVERGLTLAVNPRLLLAVAIGVAVVAVLWAALILITNRYLREQAALSPAQRGFSTVLVLALIAAVALPGVKIGQYALIQRSVVSSDSVFQGGGSRPNVEKPDPWAGRPRMNVLLIGSDAGPGRQALRADSLVLASIDTRSGNTVLLSLPRNLQKVPFAAGSPGARAWPNGYDCGPKCMIFAIWRWAAEEGGRRYYHGPQAGLRATEDAVEGVTGLKVDTYVMLNLKGFRDFVDAIGPITVNVSEDLPIGGNSTRPVALDWIRKGRNQKLDGYHALWFARSRWSTSDYSRMQRQRCVIGAVVKKAVPATLAANFPSIARALKSNLTTGIAADDLPAWVDLSLRIKQARVTSLPFTDEVISRADPDYPRIHRLIRAAISASTRPAASSATPAASSPTPAATRKPARTRSAATAQDLAAVC